MASRVAQYPNVSEDENRLQALADFCQGLFCLNEFIYVD